MALDRRLFRLVVGFRRVKYKVRLIGEPCGEGTHAAAVQQSLMLEDIHHTPELLHCGPSRWQQLTIKHNGTAWEAEAQAEVEEDTESR